MQDAVSTISSLIEELNRYEQLAIEAKTKLDLVIQRALLNNIKKENWERYDQIAHLEGVVVPPKIHVMQCIVRYRGMSCSEMMLKEIVGDKTWGGDIDELIHIIKHHKS